MPVSLNERIREKFSQLTPKQQQLAAYIAQHYETAAFRTAKALAQDVGVSEATVIRFAVSLGYQGYPEMLQALGEAVKSRITTVERLASALQAPPGAILQDVMERDMANIRRTLEEATPAVFQEAVHSLLTARRIYIIALRSARVLGDFLYFYLHMLLPSCRLLHNADTLFDGLARLGADDLAVGISFERYTRQTVEGIRFARERQARILVITDSNTSPLAHYGDVVLLAKRDMSTFIDSFVAPLSLVNALIVAVSAAQPARTRQALTELERLWERHDVYY